MANRFSEADKEIIRTLPFKQACAILSSHPPKSISAKKFILRHSWGGTRTDEWSKKEVRTLRAYYDILPTKELAAKLPGRSYNAIGRKARNLKLKKRYLGTSDKIALTGHMELVEQIRLRCKADGMTFVALDKELGTKEYFARNWLRWDRKQSVNLSHVAKAVAFFGGKLVIDWNDR